jgi:hypothetical protein
VSGAQSEMIRRLRLGELRRLFRDRCRGPILTDDDAGRDYLRELLLPVSIGPHEAIRRPGAIKLWSPTDRMRREIELSAPWTMWQRKPKARTLGERLNVLYGERERLRLRTIAPCDVSDDALELLRKRKRRNETDCDG